MPEPLLEPEHEETADPGANELEEAGADMNDFKVGLPLHMHTVCKISIGTLCVGTLYNPNPLHVMSLTDSLSVPLAGATLLVGRLYMQRGKRLKKLVKLLESPQALARVRRSRSGLSVLWRWSS